jgi:hypothetical protein
MPGPGLPDGDKPGLSEDAEVLRHRRTADRQPARKHPDRLRSFSQMVQNRPAGLVAKGIEE